MPNLILRGQASGNYINVIPLITLTPKDLKTSLLNILLFIPFGFGLPFITNFHIKKIVLTGIFLSISIEFLQLITGLLAHITFRVTDINDVIFNTAGIVVGSILFSGFSRIFYYIVLKWKIPINPNLRHIVERPQVKKS